MAACPKCGKASSKPVKEWVGGARSKKPMTVRRFVCSSCGTSYVAWQDRSGAPRVMTKNLLRP